MQAERLLSLYPYCPVWVQNLGISLYGLGYYQERFGGDFESHVAEFRERENWSAEKLADFVNLRLREVLVRAFHTTPYYRRCWAEAGLDTSDLRRFKVEDLPKLPVTPKLDLRTDPHAFVPADLAARPRRLLKYHTSGSTGTPLMCFFTAEGQRRQLAAREVRSFGWAGTSIRKPRSTIGGRLVAPRAMSSAPYYRYNLIEKQVYFSAYHIGPKTVENYLRGFNRHRPMVLTGYAYSHYLLARLMLERGLKIGYKPDALVLSSEKLTAEMKKVISEAFGARAYEEYSSVENVVLATECEEGSLHVSPDFGILEIVDDQDRPVGPGREGRIICTGLLKEAQMLIRYEIGDLGMWSGGECACGRRLPVLAEVIGRQEDVVVGPDGRMMVRFHGIFINVPYLLEGQVIQEAADRIRVLVVTLPGFGDVERALLRGRVRERLGDVRVEVECVPQLHRSERGKFRAVVSRVSALPVLLLPALLQCALASFHG